MPFSSCWAWNYTFNSEYSSLFLQCLLFCWASPHTKLPSSGGSARCSGDSSGSGCRLEWSGASSRFPTLLLLEEARLCGREMCIPGWSDIWSRSSGIWFRLHYILDSSPFWDLTTALHWYTIHHWLTIYILIQSLHSWPVLAVHSTSGGTFYRSHYSLFGDDCYSTSDCWWYRYSSPCSDDSIQTHSHWHSRCKCIGVLETSLMWLKCVGMEETDHCPLMPTDTTFILDDGTTIWYSDTFFILNSLHWCLTTFWWPFSTSDTSVSHLEAVLLLILPVLMPRPFSFLLEWEEEHLSLISIVQATLYDCSVRPWCIQRFVVVRRQEWSCSLIQWEVYTGELIDYHHTYLPLLPDVTRGLIRYLLYRYQWPDLLSILLFDHWWMMILHSTFSITFGGMMTFKLVTDLGSDHSFSNVDWFSAFPLPTGIRQMTTSFRYSPSHWAFD